jgi:hypothetical protein
MATEQQPANGALSVEMWAQVRKAFPRGINMLSDWGNLLILLRTHLANRPALYSVDQIRAALDYAGVSTGRQELLLQWLGRLTAPKPKTSEPLRPRYMIVAWPEPSALMCKDCGSVVIDQAIHGKWHALKESEAQHE